MDKRIDYYTNPGKKIGDFFLGLFGALLVVIVAGAIAAAAPGSGSIMISLIGNAILLLAGIVHFFRRGRRFIAIGMISILTIPVLLLGACAIMFSR
jgi:hypothetical protein